MSDNDFYQWMLTRGLTKRSADAYLNDHRESRACLNMQGRYDPSFIEEKQRLLKNHNRTSSALKQYNAFVTSRGNVPEPITAPVTLPDANVPIKLNSKIKRKIKVSLLQTKVIKLETDISELKIAKSELKSEVSELETVNSELETQVTELETENSDLHTEASDLEAKVTKLQIENFDLKSEVIELKSARSLTCNVLVNLCVPTIREKEVTEAQLSVVQHDLAEEKDAHLATKEQIVSLTTKLADAKTEITDLKKERDEQRERADLLLGISIRSQLRLKDVQQRLEEAEADNTVLRRLLEPTPI